MRSLALLGWAAAVVLGTLWAAEIRRSNERERTLLEQIGMFEERLRIPMENRLTRELLIGRRDG